MVFTLIIWGGEVLLQIILILILIIPVSSHITQHTGQSKDIYMHMCGLQSELELKRLWQSSKGFGSS